MRKTTRRRGRAGSSPRRSSLTAGAAACAVSIGAGRPPATRPPPPRPPIPIPKTTQRRSRAGSSPIRSSPNGGAAAWAAFPQAAPDRHRPLASRPARPEAPRARRHQQSSQLSRRAPSLLPAAPLPRVVHRSSRAAAQGVRLLPIWWVRQRTATSDEGTKRLSLSRKRSARCKTDTYAAVLSFMLAGPAGATAGRASGSAAQSVSAERGLARVQL